MKWVTSKTTGQNPPSSNSSSCMLYDPKHWPPGINYVYLDGAKHVVPLLATWGSKISPIYCLEQEMDVFCDFMTTAWWVDFFSSSILVLRSD